MQPVKQLKRLNKEDDNKTENKVDRRHGILFRVV